MATQHPDNACAPYWERDGDGFVSVYEELRECFSAFETLDVDEFMWDWEGKYADEAVIDKLFSGYYDYFKKNQLGRDKFLTFRLPNIWHEKGYSLLRSLMVILTSEDFAKDLKFYPQPLFEVILPMTERAEQLIYIQSCFQKLAQFKSREFEHQNNTNTDYLEIIPLIEGVHYQANAKKILQQYLDLHKKRFKSKPKYLRVFLARSDPAMSSGLVANVLANKIALSEMKNFSDEMGMPIYPIIGVGSLVFRGGLNPERLSEFIQEYKGVKTVTLQSAFRYDFDLEEVKKSVRLLDEALPKGQPAMMKKSEVAALKKIINKFEKHYQSTVVALSKEMQIFFEAVPKRRERRLHVGFLSYRRKVGKSYLPRAISFTAAFYSIGVPPEFIGLGQTLQSLDVKEKDLLKKYYINLIPDLLEAGRYLNKDNLAILSKRNRAWKAVLSSVKYIESNFDITLGPKTQNDWLHKNISANVLLLKNKTEGLQDLIIETGKLRNSLG